MKRFITAVLFVSVFFIGLGAIVKTTGAKFNSDEKALDLIRKARQAIGGDNAIAEVRSLRIVGRTTKTFKIDGTERTEEGETEIAMQLPDKLMKMMKLGHGDGAVGGNPIIEKQVDVVVVGSAKDKMKVTVDGSPDGQHKIIVRKDDGTVQELTGAEAEKMIARDGAQGGGDVHKIVIKKSDGTVEEITGPDGGKTMSIARAEGPTGAITSKDGKTITIRKMEGGDAERWKTEDGKHIVIDKDVEAHHRAMRQNEILRLTLSLLLSAPQGMDVGYTYGGESDVDGTTCNIVIAEFGGSSFRIFLGKASNLPVMMSYTGPRMPQIMKFRTDGPRGSETAKDTMIFAHKIEGPGNAEYNVKFSDYRAVSGVQLPYKWIQTVGGDPDETFDVTSYDVNPPNIADQFKDQKVMVRVAKPADSKN